MAKNDLEFLILLALCPKVLEVHVRVTIFGLVYVNTKFLDTFEVCYLILEVFPFNSVKLTL